MAVSTVRASFSCPVQKVWDIVTSLDDYAWRSDLAEINVLSGTRFVEVTKDGCRTTFTVTEARPRERWAFDMENENIRGHWTGVFSEENGAATVVFTEDVSAKKWWIKPLVGAYLKKRQAAYFDDLKKALGV